MRQITRHNKKKNLIVMIPVTQAIQLFHFLHCHETGTSPNQSFTLTLEVKLNFPVRFLCLEFRKTLVMRTIIMSPSQCQWVKFHTPFQQATPT